MKFRDYLTEKMGKIDNTPNGRYKQLKSMAKSDLIKLFKQKNNVVNTVGVPKEDMISDILNDEFSRKEIESMNLKIKGKTNE